jgi:uncharacterized protein (TIGR02996 family)
MHGLNRFGCGPVAALCALEEAAATAESDARRTAARAALAHLDGQPAHVGTRPDEAFLRAVWHAPADRAVRLVYADWLEEHGHTAAARLLRLEEELSAHPPPDPRHAELREAVEEAARGTDADWLTLWNHLGKRAAGGSASR